MKRIITKVLGSKKVIIDIELKQEKGKNIFSVSASIFNKGIYEQGGQCLDTVLEIFNSDKQVMEIVSLWKKYHLNDMNADCIHGINEKLSKKEIIVNSYSLKWEVLDKRDKIKKRIIKSAIRKEKVYLTDLEIKLLTLEWYFDSDCIDKNLEKYYKISKSEKTIASWVYPNVSKYGVLGKPCPICKYKYGTAWNYREIPENDLKKIIDIIQGEKE